MTNEIKTMNKYLSYVIMGSKLFKIFMKNSEDTKLINIFAENLNKFHEHETILVDKIEEVGEANTDLNFMQKRVLSYYKIKICSETDDFMIAYEALKSMTNGMTKSLEFVYRFDKILPDDFISLCIKIIDFYIKTIEQLQEYLLLKLDKNKNC